MKNEDRRRALYAPLKIGDRVRAKIGQYGEGTIAEVLDTGDRAITGLARYGVRLDQNLNVWDFCRYELVKLRRS